MKAAGEQMHCLFQNVIQHFQTVDGSLWANNCPDLSVVRWRGTTQSYPRMFFEKLKVRTHHKFYSYGVNESCSLLQSRLVKLREIIRFTVISRHSKSLLITYKICQTKFENK